MVKGREMERDTEEGRKEEKREGREGGRTDLTTLSLTLFISKLGITLTLSTVASLKIK